MTNTENKPMILLGADRQVAEPVLIQHREVPLGGNRAMRVLRTLPSRAKTLIGAWCFVDYYGPDRVDDNGGMQVPGHPHTGLQTVSWLFEGEIEHKDSSGVRALVTPGEVNIMTAGSGIAHSEFSTEATSVLHGVQLWVALPDEVRNTERSFEHYKTQLTKTEFGAFRVLIGSFSGVDSPVKTFSRLLAVELKFEQATELTLSLNPEFEHGLLLCSGEMSFKFDGAESELAVADLLYLPLARKEIDLTFAAGTTVMLLGGEPFNEEIVMWWNFIARSHEEIETIRTQWQSEREELAKASAEIPKRFGDFPADWNGTLPAPELPQVKLKPRG